MPEDTSGRKAQGSFLFTGILGLFEDAGFTRERQLGKHAWLVSKRVGAGDLRPRNPHPGGCVQEA